MNENHIVMGCVADDFTGASDAASFLTEQGLRTILFSGVPKKRAENLNGVAVVIAMKTRSIPPEDAVAQTGEALDWLDAAGTEKIYFKYCSTFDSTAHGNIGPVADYLLERYGLSYTLLCPSLPVNGRTVKNGKLYVNKVLLEESHMKNHPLNPMWTSEIAKLMEPQSKYPCFTMEPKTQCPRYYLVPDYETDAQGEELAKRFGNLKVLTGGSGLLGHWGKQIRDKSPHLETKNDYAGLEEQAILLSGSCSEATKEQIEYFKKQGGFTISVSPSEVESGKLDAKSVMDRILKERNKTVLVHTVRLSESDSAEKREKNAKILEAFMADLGVKAYQKGIRRIICAGGETSGAVAQKLGFEAFEIGDSIAPGVPVMIPLNDSGSRIVLKSGNFGAKDFFVRALGITGGHNE